MTEPLPEPVAGDYGLEPQRPGLHERIVIPPGGRDILKEAREQDWRLGTPYQGVGGLAQPPPHVPTSTERIRAIYFIDPSDPGTEDGSIVPPELEGDFGDDY